MHAKIAVNRKTMRNIFIYFLKSLQNDPERPTYFDSFTLIYLHLKPTNSRAALCEDFTILFYFYIYPPDLQESDGGANTVHRVGNHPDLLPEMPRYCCLLVITRI